MKNICKFILFISIIVCSLIKLNDVVIYKPSNRYYMLKNEIKSQDKDYDVQIFGSCHAYTSFNSKFFEEEYGISSYNISNPGEIMPATYLNMKEQFKKHKPKIALVETWGINAYDTYIDSDQILNDYFLPNIELIPMSKEKNEVINDFESLDIVNENFPIAKYKDRILNSELIKEDFNYSYESIKSKYYDSYTWLFTEMDNRFENNGFKSTLSINLSEYNEKQSYIDETTCLEIEPKLMKYIDKIISLCEKNDVKLIFYRAPYISKEAELQKGNYLRTYLEEKNIPYYDLEKEIAFDTETDFSDLQHLSEKGAYKATTFLKEKIFEYMK